MTSESSSLFFESLVRGYVVDNARFMRRDWLARELDAKLAVDGKRFILLTGAPGAGKSGFMAQLAHDHPDWLRYFIRRDQRAVLADVSDKSLLLRIGYQLVARYPELFAPEQLQISIVQSLGTLAVEGEAIGAEVKRLTASPFYQRMLEIQQEVKVNHGRVVGLRVEELVVESRLIRTEELVHLALVAPAQALYRADPAKRIVILVDALDEIAYHETSENLLGWLTHCPELPENIRFVLTSRPPDDALKLFCSKQADRLSAFSIDDYGVQVSEDIRHFIGHLIGGKAVAHALQQGGERAVAFFERATDRAKGNIGYADALARGIDQAVAHEDTDSLAAILSLEELPSDLHSLYAFFLHQVKAVTSRERVELRDPVSGEYYGQPIWPAVYDRILGVLTVAMEAVDLDQIMQLGAIRADRIWVLQALDRISQFLDVDACRYRLYHSTLIDFLTSESTRNDVSTASLFQDAMQRHRHVSDYYWRRRDDVAGYDAYGMKYLAAHLSHGQQLDRLTELIGQGWLHAKMACESGTYEAFVGDVMIAWNLAHAAVRSNPGCLSTCIRFALIRTTVNSHAATLAPREITAFLERGTQSPERILSLAGHIPNPLDAANAFLIVLESTNPAVAADIRERAITGALRELRQSREDGDVALVLSRLAGHLTGKSLSEAINIARGLQYDDACAFALAKLAVAASGEEKRACWFESLRRLPVDNDLAEYAREVIDLPIIETLAALAPQMDGCPEGPGVLRRLLASLPSSRREHLRKCGVDADGMDDETIVGTMPLILTTARQTVEEINRPPVRLVANLPALDKPAALADSPSGYGDIKDASSLACTLSKLAKGLPLERQIPLLKEILQIAVRLDAGPFADPYSGRQRMDKFVEPLVAALSEAFVDPSIAVAALAWAKGIGKERSRAAVLCRLAVSIPKTNSPDVVAMATEFTDQKLATDVLCAIAPCVPDWLVPDIWRAAGRVRKEKERVRLMRALMPRLDDALLGEALAGVGQMVTETAKVDLLTALVPGLDDDMLVKAASLASELRTPGKRVRAFAAIARQRSSADREYLLERAHEAALHISSPKYRAEALHDIRLAADHGASSRLVDPALSTITGVKDERARAKSIVPLHLEGAEREQALLHALDKAWDAEPDFMRARRLEDLVAHLSAESDTALLHAARLKVAEALWQKRDGFRTDVLDMCELASLFFPSSLERSRMHSEIAESVIEICRRWTWP